MKPPRFRMNNLGQVLGDSLPCAAELPAIAELPDPFLRPDGTRVATMQQWRRQRARLTRQILHYEYGALPPRGEVLATTLRTRTLKTTGAKEQAIRLQVGPGHFVPVRLVLNVPPGDGPFAAIVRGDLCWGRPQRDVIAAVLKRGYVLADFDRTDIAPDAPEQAGIHRACPQFDGGRIAAWAWGFHRVVDYLHTLDVVDRERIAVTGHSRGGKAALLAGAIDERIALTAPNNSGCGGAGCFRLQGRGSEDIAAITKTFPYWFHERFRGFVGRVDRLPFDQHTLKALVAPRALLCTEALGDHWANPRGTQQSHAAAKEVFAFLGTAQRIGIRFRDGGHAHGAADWGALLDFADWQLFDRSPFDRPAFPPARPRYSWTAPRRPA